jgi:alpha-beta hydrolase superfamily lysophospholipase
VTRRPLYLPFDPPVFGVLHEAGGEPDVAVLLLPPFGWEAMTSHRALREWGDRLAAAGRPALRIDLPGTGDSGGSPRDGDLPARWLGAVELAVAWLRAHSGAPRLAVAGVGLGGLLAGQALARGAAIDDLVLWGAPARGRKLVRELRAFARMEASGHAAQGAPPDPGLADGELAAAGYLLTASTRAALEAIDLSALPALPEPGPRVLILDRDGVAADDDLPASLTAAGAEVTHDPGTGYGAVVGGDMQRVDVPAAALDRISAWLDAGRGRSSRAVAQLPPAARDTAELGDVRETPLTIGHSLAGVLAEPVEREPELTLVLLNAGPQRRIGPNRMWVEVARRWAPRGIASLRLDVAGIGDSDGVPAGWEQEHLLYAPERLDEVTAALDALERRGLPPRFVLMGLCSGANWAFHVAQRDPRVLAGILLNPRALFWSRWAARGHDARRVRALVRAGAWQRVLSGDVQLRHALGAALSVARYALRWPLRRMRPRTGQGGGDPLGEALGRLEGAERRLLLLFTDREPLRLALEADGGMARLAASPAIDVELVPSVAELHTLPQLGLQRRVLEIVDRRLGELVATPTAGRRTPGRA